MPKHSVRTLTLGAIMVLVLAFSFVVTPQAVFADQTNQNTNTPAASSACVGGFQQVNNNIDCGADGSGQAENQVGNTVNTVINLLSYAAGFLGIIFIIISGFKYVTSSGDQSKVASAKTTLLYALAGLAVLALCQILIHTVLSTSSSIRN